MLRLLSLALDEREERRGPFLEDDAEDADALVDEGVGLQEEGVADGEDVVEAEVALDVRDGVFEADDGDARVETTAVHLDHLQRLQHATDLLRQLRHLLDLDGLVDQTQVHVAAIGAEAVVAAAVDADQTVFEALRAVEALHEAVDQVLARSHGDLAALPRRVERLLRTQRVILRHALRVQRAQEDGVQRHEAHVGGQTVLHLHVERQLLVVGEENVADVAVALQQRQQTAHETPVQSLQQEGSLDEALQQVSQVAADLWRVVVGRGRVEERVDERLETARERFGMLPAVEVDDVLEGGEETVDVEGDHRQVRRLLLHELHRLVQVAAADLRESERASLQ